MKREQETLPLLVGGLTLNSAENLTKGHIYVLELKVVLLHVWMVLDRQEELRALKTYRQELKGGI